MTTQSSSPTASLSLADVAEILKLDAADLLDEIRNAAAAAERPTARD